MSGAANAPLSGSTLAIVSTLLALANTIAVLDMTIAIVSVPHVAGIFGVSESEGTWIITSYAIAEAITVPLTGWLARRFGSVRVFVTAVAGFGLCSLLCGLAPDFPALVFLRVLQGLFGGPMIPLSQALLLQAYPKEKAATATSIWALGSVIGPVLGPVLGGYICDNWGWSWIFLINVPLAAVTATLCWSMLKSRETPTVRSPIDFVGLGLLTVWVGALQILFDKGRDLDWFGSPFIVAVAVIIIIAFGLFLIWELAEENPIIELRIFAMPGFAVSVGVLCLAFGAYFGSVVLSSLWMQTNLGYTATYAGLAAGPHAVVIVLLTRPVRALMQRFDNRLLTSLGLILLAAAVAWRTTFASNITFGEIFLSQASMGFGIALMVLPLMPAVLGTVKPQDIAAGAGLMNFCRTTATSFATAIVTMAWNNAATENRITILNGMPAGEPLASSGLSADQQPAALDSLVQDQSVMLATIQIYWILAIILVAAAAAIWLMPKATSANVGSAATH